MNTVICTNPEFGRLLLHLLRSPIGTKLLNARALVCPEELAKADMRPFRRGFGFSPRADIRGLGLLLRKLTIEAHFARRKFLI